MPLNEWLFWLPLWVAFLGSQILIMGQLYGIKSQLKYRNRIIYKQLQRPDFRAGDWFAFGEPPE